MLDSYSGPPGCLKVLQKTRHSRVSDLAGHPGRTARVRERGALRLSVAWGARFGPDRCGLRSSTPSSNATGLGCVGPGSARDNPIRSRSIRVQLDEGDRSSDQTLDGGYSCANSYSSYLHFSQPSL